MSTSLLALQFCTLISLLSADALGHLPANAATGSDVSTSVMAVVPACPTTHTEQFTKELRIDYFPSRAGAAIPNPQSLTLRLVFNGPSWRDNDRTVAFQRKDDGSWSASVSLTFQWAYAIWYVRDDQSGKRDDNHGEYWDLVFCDGNGKKISDGIRYQAEGYAGGIFAEDLKRTTDYNRAIAALEEGGAHDILLYDEWVYKFRRQNQQNHAERQLINEIEDGLARHEDDSHYLRWTASFLINWQTAFPRTLVESAIEVADRHVEPGMPSLRSEFERERADHIENPREHVKALGEWLAKYPNDAFYSNQLRKEQLDLFGELGRISDAEIVFRDLESRIPQEADLYATMATIYIRHKVKLGEALMLLDRAEKNVDAEVVGSGYIVTLDENPDQDRAILNYWRGKAFAQEHQWANAERCLQGAVTAIDEAGPYALLGHVQREVHELEKAKNNYLEASIRSQSQEKYVDQFVVLSLKTGTPNRQAAMMELAGARKRNFDASHYKPALVDLPIPNFSFTSTTGEKITASSLRGRTLVLDIWATWCGPCVSELGGFEKLRQAHPELRVLLVATGSKLPEVTRVFRRQGVSRKEIILAEEQDVASFGLNGVPQTYVIDQNGHIRIVHYGALPDVVSYLESDLASIRNATTK